MLGLFESLPAGTPVAVEATYGWSWLVGRHRRGGVLEPAVRRGELRIVPGPKYAA